MKLLPLVAAAFLFAGCLALPDGLNVYTSPDGALPDGTYPYGAPLATGRNYYWAPTRTVVLAPNQGVLTRAHELFHAHQHRVILDDLGREPSNINLEEWYLTQEGRSFIVVANAEGGEFAVWQRTTNPTYLEDAANTGAYYLIDPGRLKEIAPLRFALADQWLR